MDDTCQSLFATGMRHAPLHAKRKFGESPDCPLSFAPVPRHIEKMALEMRISPSWQRWEYVLSLSSGIASNLERRWTQVAESLHPSTAEPGTRWILR